MSAITTLRRTEITDRALDSEYFRTRENRALESRALENRALQNRALQNRALQNRFMQNRYMESKLYQADSRFFEVSAKYFELADRLWLADVEDAAALLEIEDRIDESGWSETI
jgi:hypothetical protein